MSFLSAVSNPFARAGWGEGNGFYFNLKLKLRSLVIGNYSETYDGFEALTVVESGVCCLF